MQLGSVQDLRSVYRPPGRGAVEKVVHTLDRHCVEFIAKSPFFVLSTASADGVCDGSPKGGPPGFVQVFDEQRLAWADYSGNNRLDSFQNVVTNDNVALLFLIPGLDETLRVNGTAELVVDPELGERLAIDGKPARVAVVVTVAEVYIHCAKALRRAGLWSTESWITDLEQSPNVFHRRARRAAVGRLHREGPCRHRCGHRDDRGSSREEPSSDALGARRRSAVKGLYASE